MASHHHRIFWHICWGKEAGGTAEDAIEKRRKGRWWGAESRVCPQRQRAGSQPLGASSTRTFDGALHLVFAARAMVYCGSVDRADVRVRSGRPTPRRDDAMGVLLVCSSRAR